MSQLAVDILSLCLYFFQNWNFSFVLIPFAVLFLCFCLWMISNIMRGKYYGSR